MVNESLLRPLNTVVFAHKGAEVSDPICGSLPGELCITGGFVIRCGGSWASFLWRTG